MNTEDDTFHRLRRTPYPEMIKLYNQNFFSLMGEKTDKFLAEHGWTFDELISQAIQDR